MTSQQIADRALNVYWTHRDTDKATLAAALDEFFAPPEYTATMSAVAEAISEPVECEPCVITKSMCGSPWESWWQDHF